MLFTDIQFPSLPHLSLFYCCDCNKQTASHMLSNYNIDLGERGASNGQDYNSLHTDIESFSTPPR